MERIERVAFLGLGIMGRPMARNLKAGGFGVTVWNRTHERAAELASECGVAVADSPREAAAEADVVITMVVDAPDVEQVLFGEDGAAGGLREGALAIDMTTIAPSASRAIGERLAGQGIAFLDAPVTGSRPKAEDGTLVIMAGGPEDAFERARPVLEAMGELIVRIGPQGHGSMAKLINNALAATNAVALAEGLTFGRAGGVDLERALLVVGAGAGASTMLSLKSGAMIGHDFEPLFKLDHMLKDVRHCLAEAQALGLRLPLIEAAERFYAEASERGHGNEDFAAVVTATEAAAKG